MKDKRHIYSQHIIVRNSILAGVSARQGASAIYGGRGRFKRLGVKSHVLLLLTMMTSIIVVGCSGESTPRAGNGEPLNYSLWDLTLYGNISHQGLVDYAAIAEEEMFWQFIGQINSARPSEMASDSERLAFWINAYNALTIQLVLDNQPIESITDIAGGLAGVAVPGIDSPWDIVVATIEGAELTLQQIEDEKVRKLGDQRVHFAINCASLSCPPLQTESFRAERLEEQLAQAEWAFITNKRFNYLENSTLHISKIFDWYQDEFTQTTGSLQGYLAPFLTGVFFKGYSTRNRISTPRELLPPVESLRVEFLPYDWGLNGIEE